MSWLLAARALPWKLIGFAALGLALALSIVALKLEQRHSAKLKGQIVSLNAELRRISDAKNTQKQTTDRNIGQTRIIIRDGNKQAEKIEQAPTAPNCATPPEVMGADL